MLRDYLLTNCYSGRILFSLRDPVFPSRRRIFWDDFFENFRRAGSAPQDHQQDTAGQIAQRALQRQADRCAGGARHRDDFSHYPFSGLHNVESLGEGRHIFHETHRRSAVTVCTHSGNCVSAAHHKPQKLQFRAAEGTVRAFSR